MPNSSKSLLWLSRINIWDIKEISFVFFVFLMGIFVCMFNILPASVCVWIQSDGSPAPAVVNATSLIRYSLYFGRGESVTPLVSPSTHSTSSLSTQDSMCCSGSQFLSNFWISTLYPCNRPGTWTGRCQLRDTLSEVTSIMVSDWGGPGTAERERNNLHYKWHAIVLYLDT